jgi:hypothetical protein
MELSMKIHRELFVECELNDLSKLAAAIEAHLPTGWKRNRTAERKLGESYLCFACSSRDGLPNAEVWISYDSERSAAWVANVIPTDSSRLGTNAYNQIVADFYEHAAKHAATDLGFRSSLTDADVDASHFGLSKRTTQLLESFSLSANKSTGSAHPRDRERWYDFLISAHKDRADLDTTTLGRFLTESYGWSDELASDLRLEYEFARGLLERYDSSHG